MAYGLDLIELSFAEKLQPRRDDEVSFYLTVRTTGNGKETRKFFVAAPAMTLSNICRN